MLNAAGHSYSQQQYEYQQPSSFNTTNQRQRVGRLMPYNSNNHGNSTQQSTYAQAIQPTNNNSRVRYEQGKKFFIIRNITNIK